MHLSTDSNVKVQTHTDELFARTGLLIFVWMIVTIAWLINIDSLLDYLITKFDPCDDDCINLYQPEKWSEIRWIAAGILGFTTIIPLICHQFWIFTKPALTNSERNLLKLLLIIAPILILSLSYFTLIYLIPELFGAGHSIQNEYGLVAKYDVISLISFSIALVWLEILIVVAATLILCSGITENLDSSNANWWRVRIYGFMSLVIILSFYDKEYNGFFIAIVSILIVEFISTPWFNKQPKFDINIVEKFTADGEITKQLSVICDCIKVIDYQKSDSMEMILMNNICSNEKLQNDLRKILSYAKPNELLVYNCQEREKFWEELSGNFPLMSVIISDDFNTN